MALTLLDMDNAKLDLTFVSKVANVNYNASTATNRDGDVVDTVLGRLAKLGYIPPIAYAGSILFSVNDNTKTLVRSSVVYAPLPNLLPFTTTGTWIGQDENKFFVVQDSGAITTLQADVADLTTLSGVASNQLTLGTFTNSPAIIPSNQKIKQALQALANYAEILQRDNWQRISSASFPAAAGVVIPIDFSSYNYYRIAIRGLRPAAGFLGLSAKVNAIATYMAQAWSFNSVTAGGPTAFTGQPNITMTGNNLDSTSTYDAEIEISGLRSGALCQVKFTASYTSSTGTVYNTFTGTAVAKDVAAITSFTLTSSSANFENAGSLQVFAKL